MIMFFPKVTQRILLKVPKDILIRELSKEVDFGASSLIYFKENGKSFAGITEGNSFQIKLKTSYRNSFKPIVTIAFIENENGTEIFLEYRLELLIKITMSVFVSFIGLIQAIVIYLNFNNILTHFKIDYFFPLLMILALFLFSRLGFYMSQSHSESAIKRLLIVTRNNFNRNQRLDKIN